MNIVEETNGRPEEKANKILGVVLADAVVYPRTVVIELGHAPIALVTMLRSERLANDTRRAKVVQRELTLFHKIEYCLLKVIISYLCC